jgi:hypothetical protein
MPGGVAGDRPLGRPYADHICSHVLWALAFARATLGCLGFAVPETPYLTGAAIVLRASAGAATGLARCIGKPLR